MTEKRGKRMAKKKAAQPSLFPDAPFAFDDGFLQDHVQPKGNT